MGQALYRKWRPQTFDEVVGQEHIVQTLRYALRTGHIHHAYLLAGPRGIGKTTTARLIAKAVNCLAPEEERPCNQCEICKAINAGRLMDLLEIDAASNTGVDNIRDLLEKVGFRPTQATYKVYVVDEVHMLSTAAFNALLKTLEEPPQHVIFVLATTEAHKIPETILSRCQRFEFRRIPLEALVRRLRTIADTEAIEAEPEALELIGRTATGSMRDAISLFDQMAAGGSITADYVRQMLGAERREVVQSLLAAWVDRDLTTGLKIINQAIDGGADPRQLARQAADDLRGLLLMRLGAGQTWTDPTAEERQRLTELASKADTQRLVEAVRRFSEVASKQRAGWQPQLPLELAFVEATLQSVDTSQGRQPETAAQSKAEKRVQVRRSAAPPAATSSTKPSAETAASASRSQPQAATDSAGTQSQRSPPSSRQQTVADEAQEAGADVAVSQAAGAPSSPAASDTPGETETPTLDAGLISRIRANWQEIIRQLQPVTLGALLRDAEVGGADHDGCLVLTFQHSFHRDRVADGANLRRVEEFLHQAFKQPITVRCMLGETWAREADDEAAATGRSDAQGKRTPAIPADEDELIRRAQAELGAVPRINDQG